MSKKKQAGHGSPKGSKFGGKQLVGHSRQSYFTRRKMGLAQANKQKRIEKDQRQRAKAQAKKGIVVGLSGALPLAYLS